jgi:hypothetical protein
MILRSAEMGMAPSEFWALSLPELEQQFQGYAARRLFWRELGLWVAWHVACFQRGESLPDLEPLLTKLRQTAMPSHVTPAAARVAAHRSQLAILSRQYGLPMFAGKKPALPPPAPRRE